MQNTSASKERNPTTQETTTLGIMDTSPDKKSSWVIIEIMCFVPNLQLVRRYSSVRPTTPNQLEDGGGRRQHYDTKDNMFVIYFLSLLPTLVTNKNEERAKINNKKQETKQDKERREASQEV